MATDKEAKEILIGGLPDGIEQFYDLERGDISKYFGAIGSALKKAGFDLLDTLRLEINPSTMLQKIPDWENALGLSATSTALFGTLVQRRNQVLGRLRENGGLTLADIRAAMQPYFLYQDPNQIQILEPNRAALKTLHTYPYVGAPVIPPLATRSVFIPVLDDPKVSPAGAQLNFRVTTMDLAQLGVIVKGSPDVSYDFGSLGQGSAASLDFTIGMPQFSGQSIFKTWEIQFLTNTVGATISNISLFVEGLGRNYDVNGMEIGEGLGAAMFTFAVVMDLALVGPGYNPEGAKLALKRITPAHCGSSLFTKAMGGTLCAIPDLITTLPDLCIPCDETYTLTWVPASSPTLSSIEALWGSSPTDIWGVTFNGFFVHYDGTSWSTVSSFGTLSHLYGIWGDSANDIWAVGDETTGKVAHYNGSSWSLITTSVLNIWLDVWGAGTSDVWVVGLSGKIIHYDGATFSSVTSPTVRDLYGIWGYNSTNIWAVGTNGTIIRYNGTSWSTVTSPIINNLFSVFGFSPTDVWAVGTNGTIIHYNGTSWSTITSPTTANLFSVWGSSPNDIWAVGAGGWIIHYNGSTWSQFTSPTTNDLLALYGFASNDVWAAGAGATFLHTQLS